jgi:hypothetical protein
VAHHQLAGELPCPTASKNRKKSSEVGRDETEHLELGKIPQQLQMINLEIKK